MAHKITVKTRIQEIPIEDYDENKFFELPNTFDSEILILSLTDPRESQILLLRHVGYNYREIIKIMHLKNVGEYFVLWSKLRKDFKKIQDLDV